MNEDIKHMENEFKDLIGNLIKIGDTVIIQDGGRLGLGRVSHISAVGNLIIRARIIKNDNSWEKVIVTNDHAHIIAVQDIKIRGE